MAAAALTFTGVNQSVPLGAAKVEWSGSSSSTAEVFDVASAPGEIVIDVMAFGDSDLNPVAANGQTELFSNSANGRGVVGSIRDGASPDVDMDWNLGASEDWSIIGVSIKPFIE